METKTYVITIDGLSGSGKSTVARKLAMKLGFIHINSGALFRAVGVKADAEQVDLSSDTEVSKVARSLDFRFALDAGGQTLLRVDGEDIRERINTETAGKLASVIAVLPTVRTVLLDVQRDVARKHSVVVEGRDSGSVVFPDADFKFYLGAAVEIRAERRMKELLPKAGTKKRDDLLAEIRSEMDERDARDTTRAVAPSIRTDDAILIETSQLTPDEVVNTICRNINLKNS